MKRYIALLLVVMLLLSACKAAQPSTDGSSSTTPTTTTTSDVLPTDGTEPTTSTTEPTSTTPTVTEPVTTEPDVTEPTTTEPTQPSTQPTTPSTGNNSGTGADTPTTTPSKPNEDNTPDDYTLKLDKSTLSCKEYGNSKKLTLTYTGPNKDSIIWESENTKVATVDSNGNVKPLGYGTTWITVKDGVKTANCKVTVEKVTLKLSTTEMKLEVGKTATLTVSYDGENPLTWNYNSKYVSVSNGVVSAKAEGTVYITVTDGFKQAQCKVIITASGGGTTKPTPKTLKINTPRYTEIVVGSTLQIDYTYDGDKSDLTWESDNTAYFTVNSNGLVTAKSVGSTGVFVTDGNLSAYVPLTVVAPKETVTYPTTTELSRYNENAPLYDGVVKYAGDSMKFVVESLPKDSNPDTKVTSSNSSVVSVSCTQDGRKTRVNLSFKSAGTATIKITSADGAKTLTYNITVKSGYACNPGSGTLTPEQFVNAYNGVIKANGMSTSGMPTGHLVLTLSPSELTWAKARREAEGIFHEWWAIGYRTIVLTYERTDENGNYVFAVRGSSAS